MRKVINKMVSEEDLIRTVATAYGNGWRQVKLYFMCGLPTETDEDALQIADMATHVIQKGREVSGSNDIRCTVSIGGFVPKPHTPFQWAPQLSAEETDARLAKLRDKIRGDKKYGRSIGFRYHDGKPGIVEGLLSRGDRRVGAVIRACQRRRRPVRRLARALLVRPLDGLRGQGPRPYGVDVDLVHHPRAHLRGGPALGPPRPGLDKDWLWEDWQDASTDRGRGTAAGPRASTAVSAPRWTPTSRSARPARSCCP